MAKTSKKLPPPSAEATQLAELIAEAVQLAPHAHLREPHHKRQFIDQVARYADWLRAGKPEPEKADAEEED